MIKISYAGYRFPPVIIQQAMWLYARFTLSFRDVEDLLAEHGIAVSYETVRRWVNNFGPRIAAHLRNRRPKPHTTWHLDGLWCKLSQPTQRSAREHYAAYAARTAFQIPGAVLPLMRSFPSLN